LLEGIDTGYFDPSKVKERAAAVDYKVKLQRQEVSFESAWRVYQDSFDNNEMEVLNSIYTSFKKNVQSISPRNCSSTIALFKDLGRESEARELLQFYMSERREEPGFWDEAFAPGMETDPDVQAAFKESDLLPNLPSFIRRVCSGYAPDRGVLRTQSV
jgi:hypothetical protein